MVGKVKKTVYFDEPGPQNTDEVLMLAKERADELGIKTIIVASSTGETGVKASEIFKGYNLIVVSHVAWFRGPNVEEFSMENREKIISNGGKIVTATHSFGGIGRAIRRKFNTMEVDEIIANVLRLFGQGMKVACEIACMAVDSGYVKYGEEVVSIAGSGRGADTAIVVKAVNTHDFFEMKIKEIICKP
ncbi:MAG: pyruvate kinase alpha/beta domain-containing protein [Candidatus Methanomethylicia archaeon]